MITQRYLALEKLKSELDMVKKDLETKRQEYQQVKTEWTDSTEKLKHQQTRINHLKNIVQTFSREAQALMVEE
jgi:predicted  nucleic acid-binding Zn-ribbon protein